MKMHLLTATVWCGLCWLECLLPVPALGHGTTYHRLEEAAPVSLVFEYTDHTPMAYAEVLVFSPRDQEIEFQNGRTDRQGHFAFLPDDDGLWRVLVHDGMGHKVEAPVEARLDEEAGAGPQGGHAAPQGHAGPTGMKIITGLSIVLNLILGGLLWRRRSTSKTGGRGRHR